MPLFPLLHRRPVSNHPVRVLAAIKTKQACGQEHVRVGSRGREGLCHRNAQNGPPIVPQRVSDATETF